MKIAAIEKHDLASEIRSGDPIRRNLAFKKLYLNPIVNGKIWEWAKAYTLQDAEPDDILQEAMIRLDACVLSGVFLGQSSVETFLLGICKNMIRNNVKKVRRVVFLENPPEDTSPDRMADHIVLEEETTAETNRDNALKTALARLTERCREALRLFYFEEKSNAEIAAERGLANAGQAKQDVYDCRKMLRSIIEKDPGLMRDVSG